ncbi:MAG: glutamate 5-kinase, partial [Planctomycetota bacterium]|nr:glutamate 5-kinase [Planctomycetota bacterium]
MTRQRLRKAKTAVIKVGSNLLASLRGGLDTAFIFTLVGEIAALRQEGRQVVLVSSGAVAAGTAELGLNSRPSSLPEIQAAAAVGQGALIQIYRDAFAYHRIK